MSDDIVGNFDTKIKEVLKDFRHKDDVAQEFKENLTAHRQENQQLVENTEGILFTTFTKSISDKVNISPAYIEEKVDEINSDLWELVKYYFTTIKPDWYEINDNNKTLKLIEGYKRPFLFTYNDNGRTRNYTGYQTYKMSKEALDNKNTISFTSLFAKGLLNDIDRNCQPEAKIIVDADIEPCEVGLYNYAITSKDRTSYKFLLIGQTKSGKILSEEECIKLLNLPIIEYKEPEGIGAFITNSILEDFGVGNLDDKISKDELLQEYFRNKEGSIAFEIEKIKLLAGRKKLQLEVTLNDLKTEIKDLKKEIETGKLNSLEELNVKKQIKLKQKELMKKEEGLFFDKAQIDIDTEENIKSLIDKKRFIVETEEIFTVMVYPEIKEQEHIPYQIVPKW